MKRLLAVLLPCALLAASAPAAAQDCLTGPFMVFFDGGSAELTAKSANILDNAAEVYHSLCPQEQVIVAGHADRSGSEQESADLSDQRAYQVGVYLLSRGVPQEMILLEAFGESRLLIETDDGEAEPQNNRVEINFGTGSGW